MKRMRAWMVALVLVGWMTAELVASRQMVEPRLVRTPTAEFQGSPWFTLDGLARIIGADLFNYTPRGLGEGAYLRVFNATREVVDGHIRYYPHEDYHLRPVEVRGWQRVENRLGRIDPFPALIRVPPGRYVIRTRWSLAVVEAKAGVVTDVILPENG